jgi:hypothetical protein
VELERETARDGKETESGNSVLLAELGRSNAAPLHEPGDKLVSTSESILHDSLELAAGGKVFLGNVDFACEMAHG